jgi:hypothetical protein
MTQQPPNTCPSQLGVPGERWVSVGSLPNNQDLRKSKGIDGLRQLALECWVLGGGQVATSLIPNRLAHRFAASESPGRSCVSSSTAGSALGTSIVGHLPRLLSPPLRPRTPARASTPARRPATQPGTRPTSHNGGQVDVRRDQRAGLHTGPPASWKQTDWRRQNALLASCSLLGQFFLASLAGRGKMPAVDPVGRTRRAANGGTT